MSVSVRGVTAEERAAILVVYDNIAGQPSLIPATEDGWRTEHPCFVARLRVGLPPALGTKIMSLDIRIGPRSFTFGGTGLPRLETAAVQDKIALAIPENVSLPRSRFSAVDGCVNWKGDGASLARLGERVLIAGGGFLLLGLALFGIGRVTSRLRLLTGQQFRPLAGAVWAVAATTAVPVYFLKRTEMLYWGGKVGFFHDTWINLLTDSFYGRTHIRGQEYIAFWTLAVTIIGAILLNLIRRPDRRAPAGGPLLSLLGLVLVFSGFSLEQHVLLGTPYLLGRTAVFYAPLLDCC